MGTSLPCFSKLGLLFSFGEKVWKQYRRSVEGSVEKRRNRKGNRSPLSEGSSIKGGLLSRTAEKGWK